MTANEIKKAWNTFKKEVQKETNIDLTGCCYMNKKQIENGTATITLVNNIEYNDEIEYQRKSIEKYNNFDNRTDEQKKKHEAECLEVIANFEHRKAAHGTKANEAQTMATQITGSVAFMKLYKAIGITAFELEYAKQYGTFALYQIRIHY